MKEKKELTEFLCTKLCHDMAGPVTGIYNGAELLGEDDAEMQKQAMELLTQSSGQAYNKLKFLRMALGSAKGEEIATSEIQETTNNYLSKPRLELEWNISGIAAATNPAAKIIMLVGLVFSGFTTLGGKIYFNLTSKDSFEVFATSEKLKEDKNFERIIIDKIYDDELTNFNVVHFYIAKLIFDNFYSYTVAKESGSIKITLNKQLN